MSGIALALLCALGAQDDVADRLTELRWKVELGTAQPMERYELAQLLERLGSTDEALRIALDLTRGGGIEPWAHYLVGHLRFQSDPGAAGAAFSTARTLALRLDPPGTELAAEAGAALRKVQAEVARPARIREALGAISRGLWIAAGAWVLAILVILRWSRARSPDAG